AERLAPFLAGLGPGWAGLSLTMPLKAAVLPLLDSAKPTVRQTSAANTIVLHKKQQEKTNTDVPGMVAARAEHGVAANAAVVLGAEATARSALVSLAQAGTTRVQVAARRPAAADDLLQIAVAESLLVEVVPWAAAAELLAAPLVVSTV